MRMIMLMQEMMQVIMLVQVIINATSDVVSMTLSSQHKLKWLQKYGN
jgi:hypothetical protein